MTGETDKVLVADDEEVLVDLVSSILSKEGYKVIKAYNGEEAWEKIREERPNLVVLDLCMPKLDGFGVLDKMRHSQEFSTIPVLVLTASAQEEERALNAGANDFLTKPFKKNSFLARFFSLMRLYHLMEEMDRAESILVTMSRIAEAKDTYTESHLERVSALAIRVGELMGFSIEQLNNLRRGAMLHDIGKLAIPDSILLKPGKLTDEEYEIVKAHPVRGYEICEPLRSLKPCLDVILHHHERWDGRGYPDGLKGEEIPVSARIVAVVDSFDAMRTKRPYRGALPFEVAKSEVEKNMGTQFAPDASKAFLELLDSREDKPLYEDVGD